MGLFEAFHGDLAMTDQGKGIATNLTKLPNLDPRVLGLDGQGCCLIC